MKLTDIRAALRERLAEYINERDRLQRRIQEISESEKLVRTLLDEEEKRFVGEPENGNGNGHTDAFDGFVAGRTPLATFLLERLRDGAPRELQELVDAATAAGMQFGDRSPGRSIHFALTGMAQNGLVERLKEQAAWRIIGAH